MTKEKEIIKVTLIKSLIGRTASQRGTVIGLGLKKMHHTVELKNTPEVREVKKYKHIEAKMNRKTRKLKENPMFSYCLPEVLSKYNIWTQEDANEFLRDIPSSLKKLNKHLNEEQINNFKFQESSV